MDQAHAGTEFLTLAIVLLGAAVLSVPIARRIGLSAIVAYLIAGMAIGPYGLGLIRETATILTVAELGVVMLLFIIGLELQVSRLIAMSRAIFGLGAAQLTLTAALIALSAYGFGFLDWRASLLAGLALALSATAIALQILEERGHMQRTYGQRAFAILLFQDMSVVPLLALVPLLAPGGDTTSFADTSLAVVKIAVAIGLLIAAGRYLLNPFFHLLASTGAREAMTAAALLVVLGAALLMQVSGMSMALGAFLAGLLLAESNYRHELEADIEPFRGLLLALFFMGIGMSLDLGVVLANLALVIGAAMIISLLKAAIVWGLFQATCADPDDPPRAGSILTGASEFAFVLLPLGASLGVLTPAQGSLLTAIAAITMFMGPPLATATDWALRRRKKPVAPNALDELEEARGSVILIGFGRFGQLASQLMLAEGIDVTAIDNNAQRIQDAGNFGFKVFFGDGARLEVLRAAATKEVRLIAICIDDREATNRIVELIQAEFPGVKIFARAYDRGHTLELIDKGVDYEVREVYESAIVYGRNALQALGLDEAQARNVEADIRRRDAERLALQQAEGIYAGRDLVHTQPMPQPLNQPRRTGRALNPEARDIIDHETEFSG